MCQFDCKVEVKVWDEGKWVCWVDCQWRQYWKYLFGEIVVQIFFFGVGDV